ncbi:hypothetical protein LA080_006199 [Diaporthe eres]|uniref:G2/M phase checkpoint control protein Sum2 n=3 Tax=Diaporthe vaccinii TaxID=105482 RepID=A0ABR4EKP9_9PEZI|nr:hypothetical protein LA080_006199 [Diaporthe eres]
MSDFLGARISLISKSDIRYVGTLYEINSNESTVSLENVRSHGSEGRKGDPSEEVSASDQVYDFIVFRGSDVKDLRIEEGPAAPKENQPPMPNDPAIVGGARAHPGRAPGANQPPGPNGPPGPPGAPGFQNPNMFPPYPPPQGWGRPGPGPPGPGGFGMGYPPQGWFPPGQAFPPNGPGPWNNYPFPPGPPGPPGMQQQGQQQQRQTPGMSPNAMPSQADNKPIPIGGAADLSRGPGPAPVEMPSDSRVQPSSAAPAPTPPVASKPSAEEVKVTAALLENQKPGAPSAPGKQIPTGPKGLTKITPAVPLPAALTARSTQSTVAASANVNNTSTNPASSAAALRDATEAARAAVAVAMAKLEQPGGSAGPAAFPANGNGMDNLTNKVNEMRVSSGRSGVQNGRGRGRGGARHTKVEVPDSDFDFAMANAKFNKEDVVKERIAGSPITETPVDAAADGQASAAAEPKEVYDKAKSFFDNISSEAKDRKANNGQRPGGREWRAEEQHRNIETFGQGSVDGGYRGYRGRGRGRGGRGRGYGGRGRGAYRGPRNDAQTVPQ